MSLPESHPPREMGITDNNADSAGDESLKKGYSTKRSRNGKGDAIGAASSDECNAKKNPVMAVIDCSRVAKHVMMWVLTHVANKCDLLTLLHGVSPAYYRRDYGTPNLADSLGVLRKAAN